MHTYWNSAYYMILFPFEQKRALGRPNTSSPNNVTTHQVASSGEEVCVWTPFEKLKLTEIKLKSKLMHCSGIRCHSWCGCNLATTLERSGENEANLLLQTYSVLGFLSETPPVGAVCVTRSGRQSGRTHLQGSSTWKLHKAHSSSSLDC